MARDREGRPQGSALLSPRERRAHAAPIIGRLQSHGSAPYQHRSSEPLSYFVTLLTSQGKKTLWGVDLERALVNSETRPKIGDLVGAQRLGRQAVDIIDRKRDAEGRVVSETARYAHRTQWRLEKVQYFAERARRARLLRDEQRDARDAMRAHPELKSTFLSVRAAEEVAARRIPDPAERERFLKAVKEAIDISIQHNEPLPSIRLRVREAPEGGPPHGPDRKREGPTR